MPAAIEQRSVIAASPEEIWRRIVTLDGINHELMPFVQMTTPRAMAGKVSSEIRPGDRLGKSWLLLFGVLPFDYDDIVVSEIQHPCRFRETSTMGSLRVWEHERTLRPTAGGTEIIDRVTFELRAPLSMIPGLRSLVASAVSRLFSHRHRRLADWFAKQDP